MHREKYFVKKRRKDICRCSHDQYVHVGWIGPCLGCTCQGFKSGAKPKFPNKKVHVDGTTYESGFEGNYAKELDYQKRAGLIKGFEDHIEMDLIVNGRKVGTYEIDFIVDHLDGSKEYVETKGFRTDLWKLKWKIFEAMYSDTPNTKLTVVQQRSGWRPR